MVGGGVDQATLLMLMDENGELLWARKFEILDNQIDEVYGMTLDSDGHVIVTVRGHPTGPTDNAVFKYDYRNDEILWVYYMPSPDLTRLTVIREIRPGGNYLIAGMTGPNSTPGGGCDGLLLELDRNTGAIVAMHNYHRENCENYNALLIERDFIYAGGSYHIGSGFDKIRPGISKFTLDGEEIWSATYIFPDQNKTARLYVQDLLLEGDTLVAFGRGDPEGTDPNHSIIFFKVDARDGTLFWAKEYHFSSGAIGQGGNLIPAPGGYICQGFYQENEDRDIYHMKLDWAGNPEWIYKFGGDGFDQATDLLWNDSTFYFTGSSSLVPEYSFSVIWGEMPMEGLPNGWECESFQVIEVQVSKFEPFYQLVSLFRYDKVFTYTPGNLVAEATAMERTQACGVEEPQEDCFNGIDDNGNGLVDCEESQCTCAEPCRILPS
ncbi:MAG: hypothetical protein D6765_10920, partial [Bacteroidetes bacterium]